MIARLRSGLTIAQAQAQVDAHNSVVERTDPQAAMIADAGFRSLVIPLRDVEVAAVRPTLLLLEAGVLGLLLIGGVNVTNLFLIRASSRSREFALRQALGADRRHVIAEVLTESLLLTLTGGLLGLAVGAAGIRLLRALGASKLPLAGSLAFDGRAALAAIVASLVLGLAIAVPIAWCSLRSHTAGTLGAESRTTTAGRAAQRLRHAFLVVEVALAFVLLVGSGLLALSLQRVTEVDPGFRPAQVLSGQIALPWTSYRDGASRLTFMTRLLDALSAQPGVVASGISTNVPFSGNAIRAAVTVEGYVPPPGVPVHAIFPYAVRGDYFRAMGIPLVEGRLLSRDDDRLGNTAVVVDEDFARFYFPHGGAIGHHVQMGTRPEPGDPVHTIVGVVGAVKQAGLSAEEALGAVYYPYDTRFDNNVFVVARTTGDADALATAMQRLTRRIDPELPVNNLSMMTSRSRPQPADETLSSGARDALRGHRRPAHRGGDVRSARVLRGASAQGNRPADGARRAPRTDPQRVRRDGGAAAGLGRPRGAGGGVDDRPRDAGVALSRRAGQLADSDGRDVGARCRVPDGVSAAVTPRLTNPAKRGAGGKLAMAGLKPRPTENSGPGHPQLRALRREPRVELVHHRRGPLAVDLPRRVLAGAELGVSPLVDQVRHLRLVGDLRGQVRRDERDAFGIAHGDVAGHHRGLTDPNRACSRPSA